MNKPERVYVLKYKIDLAKTTEDRIEYYSFSERQKIIDEYIRITQPDKWYIHDIETCYADLQEVNIQDMINVI